MKKYPPKKPPYIVWDQTNNLGWRKVKERGGGGVGGAPFSFDWKVV